MTIRVLLAVPPPLRDALREAIEAAGDLVAGTAGSPLETLLAVRDLGADFVVLAAYGAGEPAGVASHLLAEYPDIKLLSVAADRATLQYLRLVRIPVTDVTPAGLVEAMRAATTSEAERHDS
ncbi:hypothetical protein ACQPZX_20920 [Actinoplanes sp. CA-142083]|uniref:hypothetical protein n=1 Tax=Actinoplanes sp. CA-142083 TaxID=3239903 RepID=UPI003D914A45